MTNRTYVAFWTLAVAVLVLACRWLLHDYADYQARCYCTRRR
jgi:hypothetical protein